MTKYYLGYDCGSQGTKTAIYNEDSTLVAEAYRENKIHYPRPGWAEMDADHFYDNVVQGIRECLQKSRIDPHEIRGISCSGVIMGFVPISYDWKAVGPYISFLDGRATQEAEYVRNNVDPLWITECGNAQIDAMDPPMFLLWLLKHRKDVMSSTSKVVTIAHFILGRFAGLQAKDAFIDWAHMSGWIIGYNAETRDWSDRQLELLGIPRELVPRVVKPWDVIGTLSSEQARLLGLPEGIPLVAGSGDFMQSNIGSGLLDTGMCSDVAGTASIFTVDVDHMYPELTSLPGLIYSIGTFEGHYLYWGLIRAGGLSMRWFRDNIIGQTGDEDFYRVMDRLASKVPLGSDLSLFYPYLQGGDPSQPSACATWLGMFGGTDKARLWRSILESIAFEYLSWVQAFRAEGINVDTVIGTGGGSRSLFWDQIKADVLDARYITMKRSEGAVLANALLAAYGVGDIPDMQETLRSWIGIRQEIKPIHENHVAYAKIYAARQQILSGPLQEIFITLAELRDSKQSG